MIDPDISLRFYEELFGRREYFRDEQRVEVLDPADPDGYEIGIWYEQACR